VKRAAILLTLVLTACGGVQVTPSDPCEPILEHGRRLATQAEAGADWPEGSGQYRQGHAALLDYARHIVNNPECYSNVDVHDAQEALGW